MYTEYLIHFGVKGMKWGVIRTPTNLRSRASFKATKSIQKDIDSFKPHRNTGIFTKSGKLVVSSKDIKSSMDALEKLKDKKINKINKKYDKIVSATQKDIDSFKPYASTGMSTKKGKIVMTAEEVNQIIKSLEDNKARYL